MVTKVGKSDDEGTFAGARGNGEVAPIPVICRKTRLGLGVPTIQAAKDAIDFYPRPRVR
jgi:hypothetical protein